jgi:hypothetical protein
VLRALDLILTLSKDQKNKNKTFSKNEKNKKLKKNKKAKL